MWVDGWVCGGWAVGYNNLYCLLRGSMDKRHDRSRNMGKRAEDLRYCRGLKEFLRTFKTEPCPLEEEHRTDFCLYHHSPNDRRRNPYSEAGFLYYLEQQCFCDSPVPSPRRRSARTTTPSSSTPTTRWYSKPLPALGAPASCLRRPAGCSTRGSRPFSSRESSFAST